MLNLYIVFKCWLGRHQEGHPAIKHCNNNPTTGIMIQKTRFEVVRFNKVHAATSAQEQIWSLRIEMTNIETLRGRSGWVLERR